MPSPAESDPARGLAAARARPAEALGPLLESYRQYLLAIAEGELPSILRPKTGASDVVQQTFLKAQGGFTEFRGDSDAELRGWLRCILLREIDCVVRTYYATGKRDPQREVPLSEQMLMATGPSPSTIVSQEEEEALLLQALERLPKEYREVIRLRSFEHLGFAEIGHLLGRSEDAARKLWVRAVDELGNEREAVHGTRQSPQSPGGTRRPAGGMA